MASNQNLQATLNWCGGYINYQPLLIGGQEPAVSNANLVLQTILGAPFCWRFNRSSVTFNLAVATPPTIDYSQLLPDFGFMEKAVVKEVNSSDLKEIEIKTSLAATVEKARPRFISAYTDDGGGNITFRFMPGPDAAYPVTVIYQKKPPIIASVANTWSPLPDELSYIFNYGFLSLAMALSNDPRFPIFNTRFTAHLLGAQQGLDEMQRNIFLGNWLEVTKAVQRAQMNAQQGIAAKQS